MNPLIYATAALATCCVFMVAQGDENVGTSEAGVKTPEVGVNTPEGERTFVPAKSRKCKQGFVWRQAVFGDWVCVTPETRDQAGRDNLAGDYGLNPCKEGYVWRQVTPDDHVCVTPQVRQQVLDDNKLNATRTVK